MLRNLLYSFGIEHVHWGDASGVKSITTRQGSQIATERLLTNGQIDAPGERPAASDMSTKILLFI
jgi:hypothetical protein